ncbi:MAG: 50S ribosomal protein L15 [Nitrosomonas sp.]|nr:50S ribosomal protein L15 [Nitrosomonas sp.]MDP1951348.1 50S ribosomal protein L15 [Nitrosomonas sp.]
MLLNNIKPSFGASSNRRRVGRGIGCGFGKTAGRGHKGQKSRTGGFHKTGFEGGQMPLQRRLPKRGFTSFANIRKINFIPKLRVSDILLLKEDTITIELLRAHGLIAHSVKKVKIYLDCELNQKINFDNVLVSCGVRTAVESAGGSVK